MSAFMETDRSCPRFPGHVLTLAFASWILIVSVDYVACEVRLVGGSDTVPNAGRVEVWNPDSSKWIAVCANYWDFRDGQVVCRELGYPGTLSVEYYYRSVNMTYTVGGYRCYGTEKSLSKCRRSHATLCLGLQAGVQCSAPGYVGCFYVYSPSGYSPIFWTYIAYSDWTLGTCIRESRRLHGRDSNFPQYIGVRQPVCWYSLRLSRFEGRRRSDAKCDVNCVKSAGEECGGSSTLAVYDVTLGYCKDPGNITNGTREIHHGADEFYFGTILRFWCNIGFELLGPTAIQCVIDNGRTGDVSWNSSLPTCSELRPTVTNATVVTEKPSTSFESTHVSPRVTDVTVPDIQVSQMVTNVTVTALEARVLPGVTNVTVPETPVTPVVANVTVTAPETPVAPMVANVTVTAPETPVAPMVANVTLTAPENYVSPRLSNVTVTAPETHVSPRVANVTVTEQETNVYPRVPNVTVTASETHVTPRIGNVTVTEQETYVSPRLSNVTVTAPETHVSPRVANVPVTEQETNVYPRVPNVTVTASETHVTPRIGNVTVTEQETYVYPRVSNVNITASETHLSPRVTNVTVTVPGTQVSLEVPDVTVTTPVPELKGTREPDPADRQTCRMNLGLIIAIVMGVAISILLHATLLIICFFQIRGRRVKRYSFSTIDKNARRICPSENARCHLDGNGAPAGDLVRYSTVRRGDGSRVGGESNNNETSHDVIMMQSSDSEWVENEVYDSAGPPVEAT